MEPMAAILFDAVLPVVLIVLIGFLMGRHGLFTAPDAAALFRFIAQIAAPAIIVSILITTDVAQLEPQLAGLYFLSELVLYAVTFGLARWAFRLSVNHALLCALGAAFANHVLFVYPVTLLAFDPVQAIPVRSIITLDIIIFVGTIIALDINQPSSVNLRQAIIKQWRNPLVLAVAIGLAVHALPAAPPKFFIQSADFIAKAAAPCGLFATGILLAARPSKGSLKLAAMITAMRMLVHPVLGFVIIILWGGYDFDVARTTLMVTVAPVGVMALTFASRYGVETSAIAQAILWSFILSVVMIPLIATI